MAGFKIDLFKGIRPRISSRKLPVGEGQTAENTKLGSGDLEPWKDKDAGTALVNTYYNKTIYRFDNDGSPLWFEWNDYVDVARGPVKDDSLERTYYTGDTRGTGAPRMTYTTIADGGGGGPYPEDFRYLGVPAPVSPLDATAPILPENKPRNERTTDHTTSSIAITSEELEIVFVNWSVYPGSGSDDETWSLNSSALGDIAFHIAEGSQYRVTEVVDADNVKLGAADDSGVMAQTRDNDKSSVNYWHPMDRGGTSTQEADFVGWRIPDGVLTRILDHNLRAGDIIRVRSVNYTFGLSLSLAASQDVYEQDWPTEEEVTQEGSTFYQAVNARISHSSVSGVTSFDIFGGFKYDVDREASASSILEDRSYVYTYVSALGEEGPPSPSSNIITALDGDTVDLQGMVAPPTTGYDITKIRIYRTNATEAGTEFQFVKEIDTATETTDTVEGASLGEVIESTTYDPPPVTMKGITTMPNGMMVGFDGKNVHMCEPYRPHAWPPEYDQAVDYTIVGLANFGNSVAILTDGHPYVLTGSHPRNANIIPVKINQACESKESIATDGDRVYYASPDGLVEIGVNGIRLVTEPFFEKEDWAAYLPSLMVGEFHDGRYYGFYDGVANVTQAPASATISGTISPSVSEEDIIAGGETLIITLTDDTWVSTGGAFEAQRQAIINGLDAALDPATGWNAEVRDKEVVGAVVRTSDTVVTITLTASPDYSIDVQETVTITVPNAALVTSSVDVIADSTIAVAALSDYGSLAMVVSDEDSGDTAVSYTAAARSDITDWNENDSGYTPDHEIGLKGVAYSKSLDRWLAVGTFGATAPLPDILAFATSDNDGVNWIPRDHGYGLTETTKIPRWAIWDEVSDKFIVVGDDGHLEASADGASWNTIPINPAGQNDDFGQLAIGANNILGHYVYAADKTQKYLLRSPNLATRPVTDTWNFATIAYGGSSVGSRFLASGNGVFIAVGTDTTDMDLARCVHASLTGNDIGTISTYNCAGIVFGNDLWVAVSTDFRIITCAAGDENTIGNWSSPSASKEATVTINGIIYDEGDGVTQGFGYIAFGYVTATGVGVVYTSPDASTWTLRHNFSEDVQAVAAASRNPESDLDV